MAVKRSMNDLVSPRTGLIPTVVDIERDLGDPCVAVAGAQTADLSAYGYTQREPSSGSGAGLTRETARAAAIGEAVERYALALASDHDLVVASAEELRGREPRAVPPDDWALFAPEQEAALPFPHFTNETRIAWLEGWSLTRKEPTLVPACMVFIPYEPHSDSEEVVTAATSTGTACAGSLNEALLKGICEIVERDAFMIVWRNRMTCPRVILDPRTPLGKLVIERFERAGLEYRVFYTTLDLELPSFFGLAIDTRAAEPTIVAGGAAHPSAETAVLKTYLELVQGLKWKDYYGSERFPIEASFGNVRSFEDRARLYGTNDLRAAFDFLDAGGEERPLGLIPSADGRTSTLDACVRRCSDAGYDVVAADITPSEAEECGLSVAKVLIPACTLMEGDHTLPFLGGHRWQDVPVRLGRSAGGINPYPHPYP